MFELAVYICYNPCYNVDEYDFTDDDGTSSMTCPEYYSGLTWDNLLSLADTWATCPGVSFDIVTPNSSTGPIPF